MSQLVDNVQIYEERKENGQWLKSIEFKLPNYFNPPPFKTNWRKLPDASFPTGSLRGFDSVVLAMGTRKYDPLSEAAASAAKEVIVIGEALQSPGNAVVVTKDAFEAAKAI